MINNNSSLTYSISEKKLQLAHKIAISLVKEQQRIKLKIEENKKGKENKEDKGINTELSKLITYLNSKIAQRMPARFFMYLTQLLEHGETIGHSKTTPLYYESINQICNQYLKDYENKPLILAQVLAWSQRLMTYYQTFDISSLPDTSPITQTEPIVVKMPKVSEVIKPIKREALKTLEPRQNPQPSQAVTPKNVEPTETENSELLKRPTPPKSPKPLENPKPEASKPSQPPKPWERHPKKPSK